MTDWSPLNKELAIWRAERLDLPIWWRDDDAIAPGAALDQLAALAARLDLPVHLAVIPQGATQALADQCRADPLLPVLVHGWAHRSHAPQDEKKAEFGAHRPVPEMVQQAAQGLSRLRGLFGPALLPVFVPPWNRIAEPVLPGLADHGFQALSTFKPRHRAEAAPGLAQINTHLDPIDWRGTRSLADPQRLVDQLTRDLIARRIGQTDPHEPYGVLTHHLVHDSAIWEFTAAVLTCLLQGGARPIHLGQMLSEPEPEI